MRSTTFRFKALTALFIGSTAFSATSVQAAQNAQLDILVLYTQGVENRYSGQHLTRINHLLEVSNQVFVDSDVKIELSLAHAAKVDYTDSNSADTALRAMTYAQGAFANVHSLRQQHNADMVLLYRPYDAVAHGSCGLAWLGGMNTKGNMSNSSPLMFSHVGIDACPDFVTVHELGHNLGLRHSRLQDKTGGTFPYALGHGVTGKFVDIMAYASAFKLPSATMNAYKFSNPLKTCQGLPCGVDRAKSNGADAAFTLNITGPQVANYFGGQSAALVTEADVLGDRLDKAKAEMDAANATKQAQAAIVTAAVAEQTAAKKAVADINAAGGKPFAAFQTKVKALASAQATLDKLAKTRDTALAKYQSSTSKTAAANLKAYNTALSNYNKQATKVSAQQTELSALAAPFASLIAALDAATATLTEKNAKVTTEKAVLTAATKVATTATTTHKALKTEYDKLAKKLAASGVVLPPRG